MSRLRRFEFEGDDPAYILFLEDKVIELEKNLGLSSQTKSCAQIVDSTDVGDRRSISDNLEFDPDRSNSASGRETPSPQTGHSQTLHFTIYQDPAASDGYDLGHSRSSSGGGNIRYQVLRSPTNSVIHSPRSNDQTKDSACFGFIPYDPSALSKRKTYSGETRDKYRYRLEQFIAKIPSLEDWTYDERLSRDQVLKIRCRKVLGIPDDSHLSFCEATSASSQRFEANGIIAVLHQYRNLTERTSQLAGNYQKVACFQELIFMSLCAVASQTSENITTVYQAMRLYKDSNSHEKHLKKFIRGAIWANRLIFALSKTSWAPECSNVFFVGKYNHSYLAYIQLIAISRRIYFLFCHIRRVHRKPRDFSI